MTMKMQADGDIGELGNDITSPGLGSRQCGSENGWIEQQRGVCARTSVAVYLDATTKGLAEHGGERQHMAAKRRVGIDD